MAAAFARGESQVGGSMSTGKLCEADLDARQASRLPCPPCTRDCTQGRDCPVPFLIQPPPAVGDVWLFAVAAVAAAWLVVAVVASAGVVL